MATIELRKVVKFKSQKVSSKNDLHLKKIQQIHQLFQEEICVFQTVEFQNLHNTMSRSRKKLFAEWNKTLRQIVQYENRIEQLEKRMQNHEDRLKDQYRESISNTGHEECNKDLFDCVAVN